MPTSKNFLPDANVWVALASKRHIHYAAAVRWVEGLDAGQAAFCRITQMALLPLLTNEYVMGSEVVTQEVAWRVYQQITSDFRVCFLSEPPDIEPAWHRLTQGSHTGKNVWTDAYLQSFAQLKDLQVATFDQGFRRFARPEAVILS